MDLQNLLLLVCLAFAPVALHVQAVVSEDHIYFDLLTETHNDLYVKLNASLRQTNTPPYNPPDVEGKVVLGVRRPDFFDEPLRWIMVHVRIGQETETTLAITHDDLYLLGFRTKDGKWYKLEGSNGVFQGLPGSSTLHITENYGDLLGRGGVPERGGHKMLYTVSLGNQSSIEAVRILGNYDPLKTEDDQVRKAMVRFVIMICEATRFKVIREEFSGRWQEETHITETQAKYVVVWGKLSSILLRWKQRGFWRENSRDLLANAAKRVGINDARAALDVIDFLLRPK